MNYGLIISSSSPNSGNSNSSSSSSSNNSSETEVLAGNISCNGSVAFPLLSSSSTRVVLSFETLVRFGDEDDDDDNNDDNVSSDNNNI